MDMRDQLLTIDGKRLRGVSDNEHSTHIVELFAAGSRIVIAQERVPDKSCERAALPELLKAIDVRGAIVSMDAHYAYTQDLGRIGKTMLPDVLSPGEKHVREHCFSYPSKMFFQVLLLERVAVGAVRISNIC